MPEASDNSGKRKLFTAVVLLAAAGVAWWAAQFSGAQQQYSATETILAAPSRDAPRTGGDWARDRDARPSLAEMFAVDENGKLIIDARTPNQLESVLSTLGPQPTPHDVARLQSAVVSAVPGQPGSQAAELVSRYDGYRRALEQELAESMPREIDELEASLNNITTLRRTYFDADTAERMFGKEEAYSRFSIGVMRIEADSSLTPEQKAAEIDALRQSLPPELLAGMMSRAGE